MNRDGMLDGDLADALNDARAVIREHFGHDLWEADIDWEQPAQVVAGEPRYADAQLSHAIGFVHGVALALDMTARSLLDLVPEAKVQSFVGTCDQCGGANDQANETNLCAKCSPRDRGLTTHELMKAQGFQPVADSKHFSKAKGPAPNGHGHRAKGGTTR